MCANLKLTDLPFQKRTCPAVVKMGMSKKVETEPVFITEIGFQSFEIPGSHEGHAGIKKGRLFAYHKKRGKLWHTDGVESFRDFPLALNNHGHPQKGDFLSNHTIETG
jgi:hypothetical protein